MLKRILSLFLLLALVVSMCSCGAEKAPAAAEEESTSYKDFIQVMGEIKKRGDQTAELGLPVESEYYYSFAGASASAFRYAVEYVLWLKGEGDTLAGFTADSPYSGWDTIAEINYASPYTSFFEGMLYDFQGKKDEALRPVALASMMPLYPDEGLDFSYLRTMEINDLYKLRDSLLELEGTVYSAYTPEITGREWDRYLFDEDYLIANSWQSADNGNYEEALFYAKQALKANPFDVTNWRAAAICASGAGEFALLGQYIDEGLVLFPEDEALLAFSQMLVNAVADAEVGR